MIELRDVSASIGSKTIIRGVTFTASAGELTAIAGPNGSGKTTLLRAISGDLTHSGLVVLNGHAVSALKPWEAAVIRAVLPQATTLSFPYTVREIVKLGMMGGRSGLSGRDAERLPDMALARVDLSGFAGRFYQELSGGEQQRVQLARVLCQIWTPVLDGRPRWLLLDEPVSSLDIKHQLIIMRLARDFAQAGGGVIAIMHDLNLSAMFADRMILMKNGELAAFGSPRDVLNDNTISDVFGCALRVGVVPAPGQPFVLPHSAAA